MSKRNLVVLATYPRPLMPVMAMSWMVIACLFLCSASGRWTGAIWIQLVLGTGWWAASVSAHVKEHLADWRASLLPGYRVPHVVVAGVLMMMPVVLVPSVLGGRVPYSVLGQIAGMLLLSVVAAWLIFRPTPGVIAAFAAALIWLACSGQAKNMLIELVASGRGAGAAVVLGVIAFAGLLARMAVLTEEMPEYRLGGAAEFEIVPSGAGRQRSAAQAESRAVNAFAMHRSYRLDRLKRIYNAGLWARVRHWQLVTGTGWTPWIASALLAVWISAMPLLEGNPSDPGPGGILGAIVLAVCIPIVGLGWITRWRTLPCELLRPQTRKRFVVEMGLAIALDLAELTAAALVGSLVPILIWQGMAGIRMLTLTPYLVMGAVAVFLYAVTAQVLRLRMPKLLVGVMIVCAWIPFVAFLKWTEPRLVALAFIVVGLVLTWDARRRWERTDFE